MLQDLIDASTDRGALRRMLPVCRVGARINRVRDSMQTKPGESADSFHNRLQRKVKLLSSQERCTQFESCAACPRAHEIFSQQATREKFCLQEHALTVFEQLGRVGPSNVDLDDDYIERTLPNTCSIGRTMNSLIGNGDVDGRRSETVELLGEQYGCLKLPTCLHCPLGKGVVDVLLSDLSENGMRGEAGEALEGSCAQLLR